MPEEESIVSKLYEIKSILKTDPPPGAEGKDWYRYEIAHGTNCINGYKQGSLDEVTEAMEENIVMLNERQFGKKAVASKKKAETETSSSTDANQSSDTKDTAAAESEK